MYVSEKGDKMETESESQLHHPHPIKCEVGPLSRPDGSCCFCIGDTSVMAAVYGPGEVKMSKERMDKATVEVIYKPKVGMPGCSERGQERAICRTCETVILTTLHPRSAITIIVQELHKSCAYLACCINAACMSLLDAALPLRHTVAAVSCCIDTQGEIKLDATRTEEDEAEARLTFVFDSKNQDVILADCSGSYTLPQYHQCLLTCKQASKSVFNTYRDSLTKKLNK